LKSQLSKHGFTVKYKFKSKEGLRISYNPYETTGGQSRPIVSDYYIVLNKDKDSNLVIKNGKESYGEAMLVPHAIAGYKWISVRRDSVVYTKHQLKKNL
jgi:hypothetical protein